GDAGLALALRPGLGIRDSEQPGLGTRDSGLGDSFLMARLNRPGPRVAAGIAMRGIATAAIDLSDGLAVICSTYSTRVEWAPS
ncbi:MAG: hypothetical protein ACLGI7_01670, partial [Gammaproteobacteria bacterium]